MEAPQPTSAKFKLWRWPLLLSVITVALGGLVWWKSRSERLQFVEPIWSDSLAGHENDSAATGQRRKIGEVWSLTTSSGFTLFDRGLKRDFEGRYPVFMPANSFQRAVSEKLFAGFRESPKSWSNDWSHWWDSVKRPSVENCEGINVSCEVVFVSDHAVSLRQTTDYCEGGAHLNCGSSGKNFVDHDGELHAVELNELFLDGEWQKVIADFCLTDLQRQGTSLIGAKGDQKMRMKLLMIHLSQDYFAITPDGLRWYFSPYLLEPNPGKEFEVFIPFEKLAGHLRPDGPHRLFQTKVSE